MSKQGRDEGRSQRAAAIRAEQARRERNRRVALIGGIVLLLCAIVAAGAWYGGGGKDTPAGGAEAPPVTAGAASVQVGNPDAPVKVVVYEDFLCPYCRELEASTRDFLRENAAKGTVYVEYQPINLLSQYPYSAKALNAWAAVLKHASPEAALKLHDLLYENQPYEQDSDEVSDGQIMEWVKEAGADNADVRAAMKTRDEDFFATAQGLMTEANIQGTPTVFVNGKELPAAAVPDLVSQIESAVERGN